jgi:hypothetical protein
VGLTPDRGEVRIDGHQGPSGVFLGSLWPFVTAAC